MKAWRWILCLGLAAATDGYAQAGRFKQKLLAADGTTNDVFASAVDVDGDWAVLGAPKQAATTGSVYFFQWNGTNWEQQAEVAAGDGAVGDNFGEAVALSGDSAIVGATRPILPSFSGQAYVFTRSGTNWIQQGGALTGGGLFGLFGENVDIDGDQAIVGARLAVNGAISPGAAYIFRRTGGNWALEDTLLAADGADDDWFGADVAIDGDYAIVGASARSNFMGGAYLFQRNGAIWLPVAVLENPDQATNDFFGSAVDLSGDWAIVGTRHDEFQGAYLYYRDAIHGWGLFGSLPDIYGRADFYGQDVALEDPYALVGGGAHAILWKRGEDAWLKQIYLGGSADNWDLSGTRMALHWRNVLTGHGGDDDLGENAGAGWMLPLQDRNRQSELMPTNNGLHYFGSGVAVDGDRALVGAESGSAAQDYGYCSVFARTNEYWLAQTQLLPEDTATGMRFGSATALAGDYAAVGARSADGSGAAYVFWFDGVHWAQQTRLPPHEAYAGQDFGHAVETDGNYLLVGAPQFGVNSRGQAVGYRRAGTNWEYHETFMPASTHLFAWDIGFDGTWAIFGSPQEYDQGELEAGAAYVFELAGAVWTNASRLATTNPVSLMHLGAAVDIDGDWAVCGAPNEDAPVTQCGAIYLFQRFGVNWTQHLRIPAPEAFTNGYFGASVALKKPYLLACANGPDARRAYIYKQDGTNWNLLTRFHPGDGDPNELFGSNCDLSADHAAIGLDVQDARKAYLFWREAWDQQPRFRTLTVEGGTAMRLDLGDLLIGATVSVQRTGCNELPTPTNWNEIIVIRGLQPGTNWEWEITNAPCEVIRMVTQPEELENQ